MLDKFKNTKVEELITEVNNNVKVTAFGLNLGEKGLIIKDLCKPVIFVAPNIDTIDKMEKQLESLDLKVNTVKFVNTDPTYTRYSKNETDFMFYNAVFNLVNENIDVLIISSDVLSYRLPDISLFKQNIINLSVNEEYGLNKLKNKLTEAGYRYESMAEKQGEFSSRGDVIDIFPLNSELPYRVSFFDDTIESIKTYNIENYQSIENVENISICPNTFLFYSNQNLETIVEKINKDKNGITIETNSMVRLNNLVESFTTELLCKNVYSNFIIPFLEDYNSNILDYAKNGIIIFDEVKTIIDNLNSLYSNYENSFSSLFKSGELLKAHQNYLIGLEKILSSNLGNLAFININTSNRIFKTEKVFSFECNPITNYFSNFDILIDDLENLIKKRYFVVIFAENEQNAVNLSKSIVGDFFETKLISSINQAEEKKVNILPKYLYKGVSFEKEKIHFISINEIQNRKTNLNKTTTKQKNTFYLPKVGEWVVHNVFGIGICDGVERLKFGANEKDYIIIRYKDNDRYYLPTEKIQELSSYVANGSPPKLNKLGSDEFEKEKIKVKNSLKEMAFSLLELYSQRQYQKGFKYEIDKLLYEDFCKGFEYKETVDQLEAIEEIEKDMNSSKVMDRLICGDVGFGKTEVAMRAIFISAMNSKQVALLCPTTVLSEQHYNSCMTRLSPYMINVEVLNRFKTPKQQKEILKKVKEGKVDVLVGTHRLLSKDVEFNNLGLLVLDEEQKFGVEAKEKLKNMKKNLDVLTLSATPIPRTLHISMSGIRDISLIETPPPNRLPVQTIVTEFNETLFKEAIQRELKRDGQVLVIYNRVETINDFYNYVKSLVSDNVVIDIAHGQMDEKKLFNAITNLYEHKTDILISTTLIENGVDIPTANTLFCIDSDKLGLSELYQLKGRVGRSDRLAYAYFTYAQNKVLSSDASERLKAISEFSSLGSGFKIAMKDLEIRGTGNIFGKEQHGHISKVGYDMYCKLLQEATKELKGEKIYKARDCKIIVDISAYIPNDYTKENETRFRLYNTISSVQTIDEIEKLKSSINDVYGDLPSEVENLIKIAFIQNNASKIGVKQVVVNKDRCYLIFYSNEEAINSNISYAIKNLDTKAVYNLKNMPIIEFENFNKNVDKKIDLVINFLTLCTKIVN